MELMKKAAVKLSDHTPNIHLLSTSLPSCNLKNGFRRFVPQIIRNKTNSQRQSTDLLLAA